MWSLHLDVVVLPLQLLLQLLQTIAITSKTICCYCNCWETAVRVCGHPRPLHPRRKMQQQQQLGMEWKNKWHLGCRHGDVDVGVVDDGDGDEDDYRCVCLCATNLLRELWPTGVDAGFIVCDQKKMIRRCGEEAAIPLITKDVIVRTTKGTSIPPIPALTSSLSPSSSSPSSWQFFAILHSALLISSSSKKRKHIFNIHTQASCPH